MRRGRGHSERRGEQKAFREGMESGVICLFFSCARCGPGGARPGDRVMYRPAPLVAAVAIVAWAAAVDAGKEDGDARKDVQDVVFLGETRPVSLRLHVRVGGKPFQALWEAYVHAPGDLGDG